MSIRYITFRLLIFALIIWVAASLNFLLPRLVPGDPITAMLNRLEEQGMAVENRPELIAAYKQRFGLDQSLPVQYVRYLAAMLRLDFGYSITAFPATVSSIIAQNLPWTIGLLTVTTVLAFTIGIGLGALFMWRGTPLLLRLMTWFLIIIAPLPYYLVAIVLLFLLGFTLRWLPVTSASLVNQVSTFDATTLLKIIQHSLLPALSILLAAVGSWALGMRAMMITVQGEDYITLARAKGLSERRIMLGYAMRNALLPQVTALGISLATVVSGATLVEVVFLYPGIGRALLSATNNLDFPLIQGITFILVLSVATGVLLIDLIYPLLDPRITYERR